MSATSAMVAGERADRIMSVFARAELGETDDGMASISVTIAPDEAFVTRALMRIEAELMLEDADAFRSGHDDLRTSGQRGADALVLLVQRASDALADARERQER